MPTNRGFGFRESRSLGGTTHPSTRLYKIAANGRSGQFAKYKGDPVTFCSGAPNDVVCVASADNTTSLGLLGVIRGVYSDSNGRPHPLTFNQPSNGPVLLASVAGWVDVNIDPHQTYTVAADVTAVANIVGQYVVTTVGAANTAAGISGFMIKVPGLNTATTLMNWTVIGVAPTGFDVQATIGSNEDFEVVIANHVFFPPLNTSLRSK